MDRYEKLETAGEGTYGTVYKALDKKTKKIVALKKMRMGSVNEGVNFSAIREIKLLQELKHDNIIGLLDIFLHKGNMHLVYEYMESDLEKVITDRKIVLREPDIKAFMLMLLQGIEACHNNWILHRDLKPSNLLLSTDGTIKIADFGLARAFGSPDRRLTSQVVTRWYRAPELLFGADLYGPAVDMWSVGCIFAEFMLRMPYFAGDSDLDQLAKIFAALGTPTEDQWPGMSGLPNFTAYEDFPATPFKTLFTAASDEAIDLLSKMLVFNPADRITATQALRHPYFKTGLPATPISKLPIPRKAPEPIRQTNTPQTAATAKSAEQQLPPPSSTPEETTRARTLPMQFQDTPATMLDAALNISSTAKKAALSRKRQREEESTNQNHSSLNMSTQSDGHNNSVMSTDDSDDDSKFLRRRKSDITVSPSPRKSL